MALSDPEMSRGGDPGPETRAGFGSPRMHLFAVPPYRTPAMMPSFFRRPACPCVFGLFLVFCAGPSAAQPVWLEGGPDRGVSLEILKPDFAGADDATFASMGYYLSGRFPVRAGTHLVVELPVSHFGVEGRFSSRSETALGNPYLGFEIAPPGLPLWVEAGLRAPFATDNGGGFTGAVADIDRFGTFFPDVAALIGMLNYRYRRSSGFGLRLRGGASVLVNTDATELEDSEEVALHYLIQVWNRTGRYRLGGGVSGVVLATAEAFAFGKDSFHHVVLTGVLVLNRLQPGLSIQVPLDRDLRESVNAVFGVNLTVALD